VRRLGWDVCVDENGWERDVYDRLNPLYVICEGQNGQHLGSMRFLPSTGQNMIKDHFSHLLKGRKIADPLIWECTRFCLGPDASSRVAGQLMSAGGEIMRSFGLNGFVGVFDERMVRIYNRIGSGPEILGSEGRGKDRISVGIWRFSKGARTRVSRRSGLSETIVAHWLKRRFGDASISPFSVLAT
ncbi:MAG: acyl-homoserine-lactone synthase, partial [Paracoccaceae bacterium]|nr:acyl-homoserine-lactone synthase [Paracoccaceae bacterium]